MGKGKEAAMNKRKIYELAASRNHTGREMEKKNNIMAIPYNKDE